MPDLSKRSLQIELMDNLQCEGRVVVQTLQELDIINKWLGGNNVTLRGLQKLLNNSSDPLHIIDIGCGSGEILKQIGQKYKGRSFSLTGIDANPNIVAIANQQAGSHSGIRIITEDILSKTFSERNCDIMLATLFLHHFTDEQLINIFTRMKKQTRTGIVVNDLHRHSLAYYSIMWLTRLFSKSPMVKVDAPLSVQRGFKRAELTNILEQAGITNYKLKWKWAFRWQLIIHT